MNIFLSFLATLQLHKLKLIRCIHAPIRLMKFDIEWKPNEKCNFCKLNFGIVFSVKRQCVLRPVVGANVIMCWRTAIAKLILSFVHSTIAVTASGKHWLETRVTMKD